jgi:hypothetical protein
VLFWMQIQNDSTLINLLCLVAIAALYSAYTYRLATSAYLDKVMAGSFSTGLPTHSTRTGSITRFRSKVFRVLFAVGQCFTVGFLLMMVHAFSPKLRFVL